MAEHLKHILAGIGSVFISVPSARNYSRVRRGGFAQDARNLRSDCASVASDLNKIARKAHRGTK